MSRKPEKHRPFYSLLDAFKERHCPICYLARKSVTSFLDDFLYEGINDPGMRDAIRNAGGFCEKHYWQLVSFGDPLGNAIILQDLLAVVQKTSPFGDIKADKKVGGECPSCQIFEDSEKRYSNVFVENFEYPELRSGFQNSCGLCLGHFASIIKFLNKEQQAWLLAVEKQKLDALVDELSEFKEKFNYKRSAEGFGADRDVWIRAVEFLKGRSDRLGEN